MMMTEEEIRGKLRTINEKSNTYELGWSEALTWVLNDLDAEGPPIEGPPIDAIPVPIEGSPEAE